MSTNSHRSCDPSLKAVSQGFHANIQVCQVRKKSWLETFHTLFSNRMEALKCNSNYSNFWVLRLWLQLQLALKSLSLLRSNQKYDILHRCTHKQCKIRRGQCHKTDSYDRERALKANINSHSILIVFVHRPQKHLHFHLSKFHHLEGIASCTSMSASRSHPNKQSSSNSTRKWRVHQCCDIHLDRVSSTTIHKWIFQTLFLE